MKIPPILVPCILLVASASLTHATSIPIGNYSFLDPSLPGDANNYDSSQTAEEYDLAAPAGWTVTPDADGDVYGTDNPVGSMYAGTGGNAANGGTNPGSDGLLPGTAQGYTFELMNFSSLGDATTYTYSGSSLGNFVIGQSYQLSLAIGLRMDENTEGSPDYTIELTNNGAVIGSTIVTGTATKGTFTDLSSAVPWVDLSYTGAIGIVIVGTDTSGGFQQANFDNVRLDQTPEPSTYAEILGGCMLLGLVAWNRRRFRA
jgi:hypothetical protein